MDATRGRLDGRKRTKKELSCAITATTKTDEINKKNRDISSYQLLQIF
ncbi:MAG TPA: hypothetical protein VFZ55_07420 [Nitrososphaera sp.]